MSYEIETRCSYCGCFLGQIQTERLTSFALMMKEQGLPLISHGICQSCKSHVLQDILSYTGENNHENK